MRATMRELRLGLASLQFSDTDEQTRADVVHAMGQRPHVLLLTELGNARKRALVKSMALLGGWGSAHLMAGRSDTAFLVRPGLPVLDTGRVPAHDGKPGPLSEGGYGPRDVDWVKVGLGPERIYVHGLHWVVPKTPRRRTDHARATAVMIDQAEQHADGRQLSFWAGDLNRRDSPDDTDQLTVPLQRAGLVSIWDELGVYPATHGLPGPIDVIGRMRRDTRVHAVSVHVHRRGIHSDHAQVHAVYGID